MLQWDKERGYGYYPVNQFKYDDEYFRKYQMYAETPMGDEIVKTRKRTVNKFVMVGDILDVGIGSGNFIERWDGGDACGYDVNPVAVEWLKENNRYVDYWNDSLRSFKAITFFDSLEHIDDINGALELISDQWVIVAMPIYENYDHVLQSKHFRPDEHYHYFTMFGFINYMAGKGFALYRIDNGEIKAGREDIWTFVFKKRGDYA